MSKLTEETKLKFKVDDEVYIKAKIVSIENSEEDCYELCHKSSWLGWYKEEELADVKQNMSPEEVWEIAKSITCNTSANALKSEELEKIFGYNNPTRILNNFTPQQCKEKIDEYIYNNVFNPSDIVQFGTSYEHDGIIVDICGDKDELANSKTLPILISSGEIVFVEKNLCRKTGQRMNFENTLKEFEIQRGE